MDKQYILECIDELLSGKAENAFFNLLEIGPETIPYIHAEYLKRTDVESKVRLLKSAAETHNERAIDLMRMALNESNSTIWKEALNGCVMIGGAKAKKAIDDCLGSEDYGKFSEEFREWAVEAIEQMT